MSAYIPNGSTIHQAEFGASKTVTGITNANPAVATSVAHGMTIGDIVYIKSGWGSVSGRAFRVGATTADTFELAGMDTTDVVMFPVGGGAGTAYEAGAQIQIQQILNPQTEGGEIQYQEFQFLEDTQKRRLASGKSAMGLKFAVGFDDTLPGFAAMEKADNDQKERLYVVTLPNGTKIHYVASAAFNSTPSLTIDQVMACDASLSFAGKPVRYNA